jgi:hypothetical protein
MGRGAVPEVEESGEALTEEGFEMMGLRHIFFGCEYGLIGGREEGQLWVWLCVFVFVFVCVCLFVKKKA